MFDAKSVRRALLLTTVLAVSAAPAASARVADAPVPQTRVAVATTAVPPRVDGIGQPPSDSGAPVAAPTVQASSDGGFDWALGAIVAAGLLSLVLVGAAGWKTRSRRLAHN